MKKAFVIAKKEFRSYFLSPIGYAVLGAFLLLVGHMFYQRLIYFIRQDISGDLNTTIVKPLYSTISMLLLFVVPIITMRSLSEEKKTRSIELLLSSPVRDHEIVLGKYLGAMFLVFSAILSTMMYPIILYVGGNLDIGQVTSMYIGLLMLSGAYVAVGLFFSSITENQIVSAILSFVTLLLFWVVDWAVQIVPQVVGTVLAYISIIRHFEYFGQGVLSLADAIYYISFCYFIIYLAKSSRSLIKIVLVLLAVVLVNMSARLHDLRLDVSRDKVNSLSKYTMKVLRNMEENVHFKAVLSPSTDGQVFKRAIDQYTYHSSKISYDIVDPRTELSSYDNNSDINTKGPIQVSSKYRQVFIPSITEESITSALIAVTRPGQKRLYFLGDGTSSIVEKRLQGYGYDVYSDLKSTIDNKSVIIIAKKKTLLAAHKTASIKKHLSAGGNVILLTELDEISGVTGIRMSKDIILDERSESLGYGRAVPIIDDIYKGSVITKDINSPMLMPYTNSLLVGKTNTVLCNSQHMPVCAMGCIDKSKGCVAVIGNKNFVSDKYIGFGSNYEFFINLVMYMSGEADLISERPKPLTEGYFDPNKGFVPGFFVAYVIPLLLLITGITVWYKRKRC